MEAICIRRFTYLYGEKIKRFCASLPPSQPTWWIQGDVGVGPLDRGWLAEFVQRGKRRESWAGETGKSSNRSLHPLPYPATSRDFLEPTFVNDYIYSVGSGGGRGKIRR
jgi:hypothetical protein